MQGEATYPKDGGDSIRVQHPSQERVVQIHEVLLVDDYHLDPALCHTVSTSQLACTTPSHRLNTCPIDTLVHRMHLADQGGWEVGVPVFEGPRKTNETCRKGRRTAGKRQVENRCHKYDVLM